MIIRSQQSNCNKQEVFTLLIVSWRFSQCVKDACYLPFLLSFPYYTILLPSLHFSCFFFGKRQKQIFPFSTGYDTVRCLRKSEDNYTKMVTKLYIRIAIKQSSACYETRKRRIYEFQGNLGESMISLFYQCDIYF